MSQNIWYDDVMTEYTNMGLDVPEYIEKFSSPIRELYPGEQSIGQEILEHLPYVSHHSLIFRLSKS